MEEVFVLLEQLQDRVADAPARIVALLADPEVAAWSEVNLMAEFCLATVAFIERRDPAGAVADYRRKAEALAKPAMVATALAMGAREEVVGDDPDQRLRADADLARAVALLGELEGVELERVCAHIQCAIALDHRRLWELADEQYELAERLLPWCGRAPAAAAMLFNRVEIQLKWICALREIGDLGAVAAHHDVARRALAAARRPDMPASWVDELQAIGLLIAALAGDDVADEAEAMLAQADRYGDYLGHIYVAAGVAHAGGGRVPARSCLEQGLALLEPHQVPTEHELALCLLAELDAAGTSASPALRWARRKAQRLWAVRLSSLASMRALIHAERLRRDHDQLSRHAYLDELTGLANRRQLQRYLGRLQAGVARRASVILVDVDHFKLINDRFGHAAGDQVLVELAELLRANVRSGDLAVRQGGDEFMVVLSGSGPGTARRRAAAILATVQAHTWSSLPAGEAAQVSVGLACGLAHQLEAVAEQADLALYRAKAVGGGCLRLAPEQAAG
jgi:diguanylate cyclase (GGDEF)-like protein